VVSKFRILQWGGYRAFWIYDPKKRLIRAAPFRDRVVHHALYRVLAPIVERAYIADTYACLVGRGSLAAVRRYEQVVRRQRGSRLQAGWGWPSMLRRFGSRGASFSRMT